MIRALALVLLIGCGRLRFEEVATDAQPDAGPCVFGPFSGRTTIAGGVNKLVDDDWMPSITSNDLTLYFYSVRFSVPGSPDIWQSTRTDPNETFPAASVVTELSSTALDWCPRPFDDDRSIFVTTTRAAGDLDVYFASRSDTSGPFSMPMAVAELNSANDEECLAVSLDGIRVIVSSTRNLQYDLFMASRPDIRSAFGPLQAIVEVNSTSAERVPALTSDELELFFVSDRPNGLGENDIWRAVRPSIDQPFGPAENVTELNSVGDDFGPYLSHDGTQIYYSYNADIEGAPDDADVWVATRSCL